MAYTVYHPTVCEECGADLTAEAGVAVHWSVGGHEFDVYSYVHPNGILADPCDDPVAKGLHAGTYCAQCGELVEEIRGPRTRPTKTKAEKSWTECEICGCEVSPQNRALGMPIHGECWQRMGPAGRERHARRHGVPYDAREELQPEERIPPP